jgi:hypothetical protein
MQLAKPLGDTFLGEPIDGAAPLAYDCPQAPWRDDPHGSRTILTDVGEERERVAGRYPKSSCPPFQYHLVVGQQPPKKGVDRRVLVPFRTRGIDSDKG